MRQLLMNTAEELIYNLMIILLFYMRPFVRASVPSIGRPSITHYIRQDCSYQGLFVSRTVRPTEIK